jgi:hypothetical protein
MMRLSRVAFLVAVCVLAVGFLPAPAATSGLDASERVVAQPDQNGPSYASPDTGAATGEGYESPSLDLGAAVQADAQQLRAEHEQRVLDVELTAAFDASAREFVAEKRLEAVASRYQQIAEREAELLEAYGDGEIDTALFLSELTTLRVATEMQSDLQAEAAAEVTVPERLLNLEGALWVESPVLDHVAEGKRNVDRSTAVYVLTGEDSYVLGTVDDGTFLRQATLRSGRNLSAGTDADQLREGGNLSLERVSERTAELYPWIDNQLVPGSYGYHDPRAKVYEVTLDHPKGELLTFLDGATTDVFHENHWQPFDRIEFTRTVQNNTSGLNVSVDQTRETGPMRLTVTANGQPVPNATVRISDQVVGTTNAGGVLWTVEPRIASDLSVTTTDGDRVLVSL